MAWLQLVVINSLAGALIYAAPITEHFETKVMDAKGGHLRRKLREARGIQHHDRPSPAVEHLELQQLDQAHTSAMRVHLFLCVHCRSDPLLW